jgi:hypothetical protein
MPFLPQAQHVFDSWLMRCFPDATTFLVMLFTYVGKVKVQTRNRSEKRPGTFCYGATNQLFRDCNNWYTPSRELTARIVNTRASSST